MENLINLKRHHVVVGMMVMLLSILIGFGGLPVTANQGDFVTVYPTANTDYFTNPGIGFQRMEHNTPPLLSETVVYPTREDISWQVLNPSNGSYNWSVLDNKIQAAAINAQLFSFRVYTMQGESYGGHHVPQWVVNSDSSMIQGGAPNYANCSYQMHWATFVNALRLRYDGDSRIAFIDISGYGNFNEWSWTDGQTEWEDDYMNPSTNDGYARIRLADMFIGGSNNAHRCENSSGSTQVVSYSYTGFQDTQLVMPYAGVQQSTRYVADRRSDVGIRYDCLGRNEDSNSDPMLKIGDVIGNTWRNAPIVFEFCANSTTNSAYMNRAEALLNAAHGVLVHENLEDPRDTLPLERLMTNVGYRYQLTQATYDSNVEAGESLSVTMAWQNIGTSPAYPNMGYDFALHLYLLNSSGQVVAEHLSTTNVSWWMPADPLPGVAPSNVVGELMQVPGNLPDGDYQLHVAIVNITNNQPINLAIDGADGQGRYFVGTVNLSGDEAPPVEPTATITPTLVPTETPETVTPSVEPTATSIPPTEEPATEEPPAETTDYVYISEMDGQRWTEGSNTWAVYIDIMIQDSDGEYPSGVTVTGAWHDGTVFTCITSGGWCGARKTAISRTRNTATLTIEELWYPTMIYNPSANLVASVISVSLEEQSPEPDATATATEPYIPSEQEPTSTPMPTMVPPTITPIPTMVPPTITPIPTMVPPTITPIPPVIPPSNNTGSVHISNLDGQKWNEGGGTWAAYIDITVVDNNNQAISGVTVTAQWHDGTVFTCITSGGWCGARLNGIPNSINEATLSIINLSHPTMPYAPSQNSDPQAGRDNNKASNGTVITVIRRR